MIYPVPYFGSCVDGHVYILIGVCCSFAVGGEGGDEGGCQAHSVF